MAAKTQLDSYRKSLLNRVTASCAFTEYIENTLAREDEAAKHSFHKIMIHNWSGTDVQLFETMSSYFSSNFIPLIYTSHSDITYFYTSSLSLILKMIRLDFMFSYQRNMFNVDILFNDKNSAECFDNTITLEDIVCSVVSRRFTEKFELDLSNFCNDQEFEDKQINFYKLSLLAHYKILMLRMGRDTKSLNLSNNNLNHVPLDILNFFIKGDLTAINLSNNQIPSVQELLRVSSKIEKLWLEGNPLCETLEPAEYVKVITMKFPRLIELDGVRINEHGCQIPFYRNFLVTPDRKTKMIVEKFLTIYFTHYDSIPRRRFKPLYEPYAVLMINSALTEREEEGTPYVGRTRNAAQPSKRAWMLQTPHARVYCKRGSALHTLNQLPPSEHDPTTFTVDVLVHTPKCMVLVVDGIFREPSTPNDHFPSPPPYRYYSFRRTLVFTIEPKRASSVYTIAHEMLSLRLASKEQMEYSFQHPIRNMNELPLINPEAEERDAIITAFMHLTTLKRSEAEARLKLQNWDIKKALKMFLPEFRDNKVSLDKMIEEDDFSDTSSLVDDEID